MCTILSKAESEAFCQCQQTDLSSKPQLSSQALVQNVIGELDAVVAAGAAAFRHDAGHDLVDDGEHFVLAVSQLVHEARAPVRVLAAVETVQLGCDAIQLLVGIVELGQK